MTKVKLSPRRELLLVLDTEVVVGKARIADTMTAIGRAVLEGKDTTQLVAACKAFMAAVAKLDAHCEALRRETNERLN